MTPHHRGAARTGTGRAAGTAIAIALIGAYLVGAAVSGHLSPLARRPLLDGTLTPTAYRWVDPPPALASQNQPPASGTFRTPLTESGSRTAVLATKDTQVTVILEKGAFAAAPDETAVEITITPIATSEVQPADPPLHLVGNVVRIDATYVPSGDAVDVEPGKARVVLFYPIVLNQHGGHEIVSSPDGETWTSAETNDLPSIQQADGVVPTLNYVAVAVGPAASPTTAPGSGGVNVVATVVIVVAIVVLLAVLLWTLRRRSTDARPAPKRPAAGTASAKKAPTNKRTNKKKR